MISVEEALERILGFVHVLEAEDKPLLEALGQVLAEDVISGVNIPPLDNSAMDGYAVRSQDTFGADVNSPAVLRVIDTVMAGSVSVEHVTEGTAVRIMTGAPLPAGADAVVQFENTDEDRRSAGENSTVEIGVLQPATPGLNVRFAGEDVKKDATVLKKGSLVRPAEVGVAASIGRGQVNVIRRPLVAVLATGNELTPLDEELAPGRIYNSNTYSVAALVKRCGGIPLVLDIARDTSDSLVSRIREAAGADMLITSGGVSMGDYDVVKEVLAEEGEISFWTVRMKPGKPLAFGMIRTGGKDGSNSIPHLGLPGNPVSSMLTFELFARPAMFKMMGRSKWNKPVIKAALEGSVRNTDGRRVYARASVEKRGDSYFARVTGPQGSGILSSMSQANGLVIIGEEKPVAKDGDIVPVMMLDWNEEVDI